MDLLQVLEDIAQLAVEPEPDQSTEGENGTIYGKLSSCILFVLIEAGTNLPVSRLLHICITVHMLIV